MPAHSEQQFSPFAPRQLFDLVADIERYPEFLPWCRAARILEKKDGECMAELVISFKHMTESYVSRVTLKRPKTADSQGAIDVEMVRGPFEYLTNCWAFVPVEGGTRIEFVLDFKFRSRLLEKLIGGVFARATGRMAQAFNQRAHALYGKAGNSGN